ncbi:MFS transporter [Pseudomonas sp. NFR16]|uniref:MFS transporter n=1 Tax=Pseudomonas sp. NFR16 TaxID=1566248 RepID=UPI0008BBAAA6|nr:MFS transporter [Pseudomonas sp. NFR16]SEI45561.1 Predicted arabinose efflux permease, MFS family [Pseudomonas sp. NFR16]
MTSHTLSRKKWPTPVRALAHRDFQVYFFGQAVSTLGKWVQQVALTWLAYHLTGSASLLGLLTFLSLAPQLCIGPLAGAWTDKHDKRRLLLIAQALLAAQSLFLSVMTWLGCMNSYWLIAMALVLGVLNAFETPLRQALIGSFVADPADLPNALALNAMLINAARFVGPPLAGALIAYSGEAVCFLVTAFAFSLLLFALMKVKGMPTARVAGKTGQIFRAGLTYMWDTLEVRRLLMGVVVVNLLSSIYAVLLPVITRESYQGDATTLGWLWGAAGAGAFVASFCLALGGSLPRLARFIVVAAVCCACGLAGLALNMPLGWAMAALAILGFGITASNVSSNMLLQSQAPAELRGRVVAFYLSMRFGFEAIGGLFAGLVSVVWGAPATLGAAGVLLLGYMLFDHFYWRARATPPTSTQ